MRYVIVIVSIAAVGIWDLLHNEGRLVTRVSIVLIQTAKFFGVM